MGERPTADSGMPPSPSSTTLLLLRTTATLPATGWWYAKVILKVEVVRSGIKFGNPWLR